MIVTDILDYDKRKVLVQLDEYLMFPLYKSEVTKYRLIKEAELSEAVQKELLEELLPKRTKLRAMHLLEKRSYTRAGLKRKLLEGRYPDRYVEEALDYVSSYGYLDDMRYAEEYICCYAESRSRRRIQQELSGKGVCTEIIESVWEKFEAENQGLDEVGQIKELLLKKHFDAQTADRKEILKIMNYLYRKGYSMDSINHCIRVDFQE